MKGDVVARQRGAVATGGVAELVLVDAAEGVHEVVGGVVGGVGGGAGDGGNDGDVGAEEGVGDRLHVGDAVGGEEEDGDVGVGAVEGGDGLPGVIVVAGNSGDGAAGGLSGGFRIGGEGWVGKTHFRV